MARVHDYHRLSKGQKLVYHIERAGARIPTCRCGQCRIELPRRELATHKAERCPGVELVSR